MLTDEQLASIKQALSDGRRVQCVIPGNEYEVKDVVTMCTLKQGGLTRFPFGELQLRNDPTSGSLLIDTKGTFK